MSRAKDVLSKLDESGYRKEVLRFMDYPWQEDQEIYFIALLEENRRNIETASDSTIRRYLQDLDKVNKRALSSQLLSDNFLDWWDKLIK